MWLILCLLIGIPKLLYHFLLTSLLLVLFLCYKIFGRQQAETSSRAQLQEQFQRRHRLLLASGGQLKDKIKFAIMRGTRGAMRIARRGNVNEYQDQQETSYNPYHLSGNNNAVRLNNESNQFYLANLAVVYVILIASCCPAGTFCLEQVSNLTNLLLSAKINYYLERRESSV